MPTLINQRTLEAARSRIGADFHYHSMDCNQQGSQLSCMESGLGQSGAFDCSGLVIASLCEVVEIDVNSVSSRFRHSFQIARLPVIARAPESGDIGVFYYLPKAKDREQGIFTAQPKHVGILSGSGPGDPFVQAMTVTKEMRPGVSEESLFSFSLDHVEFIDPAILLDALVTADEFSLED